jgi:hypothetical protein
LSVFREPRATIYFIGGALGSCTKLCHLKLSFYNSISLVVHTQIAYSDGGEFSDDSQYSIEREFLSRLSFEPWKNLARRFRELLFVKAALKKAGVRLIGRMARPGFDCLAKVLRADREDLSLHAAASPRCPFGLPNRQDCIRVRGRSSQSPNTVVAW